MSSSGRADEHRPERLVLLAVDQELGEGATLRVAPELSDPVGSLEVGEHQDVEKLGAGSGAEGVEALSYPALEFVGSHAGMLELSDDRYLAWRHVLAQAATSRRAERAH
jgi:hypothetical protein